MIKCSKCYSTPGKISLSYGGQFLCETCFTRFFEKRVRKTIRANKLLAPKDKILAAVSGGVSSQTTLYILKRLMKWFPKAKLGAVTLESDGRRDGVDAAKKLCESLGVEHAIVKSEGGGIRLALERHATDAGATKLAVGRNLDDEILSFWTSVIEGDFAGVCETSALVAVKNKKNVVVIKPLRDTPENEITDYARINDIAHRKTRRPGGNAVKEKFRRLLEQLEKNHPGSKFQLLSSINEILPLIRDKS